MITSHRAWRTYASRVGALRRATRSQFPPSAWTLTLLSRELVVTAAELSGWREAFLAAGEASLRSRPADARDLEIGRLQAKVGELTMTTELLEAKIERLETHRPLAGRRSRR
jgi:transposase